jgi:hypothetical protein
MLDRMRWQAAGAPLADDQVVRLAQHVEHWCEKVRGYDLLVPRERAPGVQLYGELLLLERVAVHGALIDQVTNLLAALSELAGLAPSLTLTLMTEGVVFTATPMGFERRARVAADEVPVRPESWVPVGDVAQLAVPILSLAEEAALHAVPISEPKKPTTAYSFEDLDRNDDATARVRVERITIQAAASAALMLVAALRDRPRSEDQQRAFDHSATMLGLARTKVAPTLVLLLEGTWAEGARDADWCELVRRTVEADERTRDDVAAVRAALADGSLLTLSAERRAQLLAYEAEDVEHAKHIAEAAQQWFVDNRERLEELTAHDKPSS